MRKLALTTCTVLLGATAQILLGSQASADMWRSNKWHGGQDGDWDDRRLTVRDSEEIRRTFKPKRTSKTFRIEVDDLEGSIEVVGHDRDEVQLVAHRINRARSQEKLAEAKRDVQLQISEEQGVLSFYVDTPQRNRDEGSWEGRSPGYAVHFDFELQVPKDSHVSLRTINDGEIKVSGVHGGWDVENINGGIEMADMAGSGRVYALNGEVHVSFARNPTEESYFGSLNGDIEVAFRDGLAADLLFKTRNGEAYTDFSGTQATGLGIKHERRGDKNVYSMERGVTTQVGRGGPDLEFDAFNGDIRILNRDH